MQGLAWEPIHTQLHTHTPPPPSQLSSKKPACYSGALPAEPADHQRRCKRELPRVEGSLPQSSRSVALPCTQSRWGVKRASEMLIFSLKLPFAGTVCRIYRERSVANDPRAMIPEQCASFLPGRSPDVYRSRCMKSRCFQPAQAFSLGISL